MKQEEKIPLCNLSIGMKGRVLDLLNTGLPRRRMLDLGLVPGTIIEVLRSSPLGDPVAYYIREAIIALREEEASQILVKPI